MRRKVLPILLLFILLLLPFRIQAKTCETDKVYIEKVSIAEKSDNAVEVKPPIFKNRKISLNVKFKDVGDYITYKILIKNDSEEDFALAEDEINKDTAYIEYLLKSGSGIVKAGKSKEFLLKVSYKTKVEAKSYNQGIFIENETFPFDLSNNMETSVINTNNEINLIFIIAAIIVIVVTVITKILFTKTSARRYLWIVTLLLLIPVSVSALCSCKIKIDSKVQIDSPLPMIKVKYVNCGTLIDGNFEFRDGMTVKEWVYSEYLNDWVNKRMKELGVTEAEIPEKAQLERQYLLEYIVSKITNDENYILKTNDVLEYTNSEC